MDTHKQITMVGFMWSIVKQLPLPILFAIGIVLGLVGLWLIAHLAGIWALVILFICVGGGAVWLLCYIAKDGK
jgi:hypothetical protein